MADEGRILILAHERDAHIPYVTRHLGADEFLVVDTKRILFGDHLSYRMGRGSTTEIRYKGEPIGPVKSIWLQDLSYERMGQARMLAEAIRTQGETRVAALGLQQLFHALIGEPSSQYWPEMLPVEPALREYSRSGLNRLALALSAMYPGAFWVSSREAIVQSSHKPLQLQVAQECGFAVPETLMTSDADEARAFLERLETCVMKPLSISAPAGRNQFTTILQAEEMPDFTGLHLSPQIFQELVSPARELRITTIGSRTFAIDVRDAEPLLDTPASVRDWRAGFEKGTFTGRRFTLPADVEARHLRLVRKLGLVNGMTDVIISPDGEYVYLETNPCGAFGFVEDATDYPVGKTFAELLRRGSINTEDGE